MYVCVLLSSLCNREVVFWEDFGPLGRGEGHGIMQIRGKVLIAPSAGGRLLTNGFLLVDSLHLLLLAV